MPSLNFNVMSEIIISNFDMTTPPHDIFSQVALRKRWK
ncbi:MAG: hypothetical protein A4E71_01263 [Smithella sp. PtaU1.Bin162]|nr:MAG: hypothetical protein A4E71_01263 [Smithella sp. PtaU1.Bin162]